MSGYPRLPLQRRRRSTEGLSRYYHPNGWSLRKARRDWNHTSTPGGYVGSNDPKEWWEVYPYATRMRGRRGPLETFDTLRAARAWCDGHRYSHLKHGAVAA